MLKNMRDSLRVRLALSLLVIAGPAWSETFTGQIVHVADGDTITLLTQSRQQIRIRIAGIDAPERAQPFGNRSRQSLHDLCNEKTATVQDEGKDRYGRTIGNVTCAGIDANAEQVRRGMAWVYDRYTKLGSPLYALQEQARAGGAGLWADAKPTPPWEWRRKVKAKNLNSPTRSPKTQCKG